LRGVDSCGASGGDGRGGKRSNENQGCRGDQGPRTGKLHVSGVFGNGARENETEANARGDTNAGDPQAFDEDVVQNVLRPGAEREPDSELMDATADRKRRHARDTNDGNQQCECSESAKDNGIEAVGSQDFRANVVERAGVQSSRSFRERAEIR
jgi:hypothetical protein